MVLWSETAIASQDSLKGLVIADFIVQPPSQETVECGGDLDSIRDAMLLLIQSYTKIRDPDGVDRAVISLIVDGMKVSVGCFYAVRLHVFTTQQMQLLHQTDPSFQTVSMWESGITAFQPFRHGGSALRDAVDTVARAFSMDWQKANP